MYSILQFWDLQPVLPAGTLPRCYSEWWRRGRNRGNEYDKVQYTRFSIRCLGMLGGVDGDTSLRLGNEHEIELIDRSCGPTSGRWDAPGGGGGEHLVREYFSLQSSATQNVIRPVDLFFGWCYAECGCCFGGGRAVNCMLCWGGCCIVTILSSGVVLW